VSEDPYVVPDLEALARRVYELHREHGRNPGPRWDELPEPERSQLIVGMWRLLVSYEVGASEPREVRIEG
jgi:hypothetical protein